MQKNFYFLFLILFFVISPAFGEDYVVREPAQVQVVEKIEVRGNKKIELAAITNKLETKPGDVVKSDKIRKDIKALFDSGFFYDIKVESQGSGKNITLIYTVVEKPSILEIKVSGNSELKSDEIKETSGLKIYEILDTAKVVEAVEKIEKLYEEKGYFLARVQYVLEPTEEGVRVVFNIAENDQVRVKQIRILGNEKLSDTKIKSMLQTQEGGFFSFISSSNSFKQDVFDQDVRIISYLYFNEGYIQAKVDRPQVFVTPDKKSIYITIRIEEGDQFKVGRVDFITENLFSNEDLLNQMTLKEGDVFSSQKLQADLKTLQAKYGDLGYAYANPIPRTDIKPQEKIVNITYEVEKGQKVFINRINMLGNSRTRDKVIRRELKISEGELYNETRKRESEANVQRLGYFDEVVFSTSTPEGHEDLMDIDIIVKERNTGQLQVGFGMGTQQGFVFMGQVNETNLFGTGRKLGLSINANSKQTDFKLNFTEPYFRDTDWSLGVDAYNTANEGTEYKETVTGGALRVGHPIAEYTYGFLRYKVDYTKINLLSEESDIFPVSESNGQTNSVTATISYDKRNDSFMPSDGIYSSISLEYAGLFGGNSYTKGIANFRYYKKVFLDFIWRNNLVYGTVASNESGEEPPFNQVFLLGGQNTLRGYYYLTVGKRKYSLQTRDKLLSEGYANDMAEILAWRPYGGKQQFYYNLELMYPLVKEQKIFGLVFFDAGEAQDSIDLTELRANVGFGFRWISPLGPLRFEWGLPLNPEKYYQPKEMFFNFNIGAPF